MDPDSTTAVNATGTTYSAGSVVKLAAQGKSFGGAPADLIFTAPDSFAGDYDPNNIAFGKWVRGDTVAAGGTPGWHKLGADATAQFGENDLFTFSSTGSYVLNNVVEYNGKYYKLLNTQDGSGGTALTTTPDTDTTNYALVTFSDLHGTYNAGLGDSCWYNWLESSKP